MRYKLEQLFTANNGAYLFYFLRVCTWMGVINFQHFGNTAAPWKYLCIMGIFSDESCVTRSATDSFCIPSKGCLIVIAFCRQGRTIHQLYSSIMTSMINYSTNVCGFYQKILTVSKTAYRIRLHSPKYNSKILWKWSGRRNPILYWNVTYCNYNHSRFNQWWNFFFYPYPTNIIIILVTFVSLYLLLSE